jgi:tetratricopeptide (TPR) repeat protein
MQTAIAGDVARARRLMALLEGAVAAHGATAAIAARLAFARATLAVVDGDIDAVLAGVAEAIARHDELGDVRTACLLRGNLAWALTEVGAAEEACAAALDGAARAEAAGIGLAEATCVANHALALWQLRALDEALAVATRAAQLDAGEPSAKGRLYSVRLLTALGRLDEAERLARAVCGELSAVPSERALAHAALAEALLARGHTVEALAAATLAATTLTDLDAIVEGKAMIRLIHAEALLAAGREGEARAVAIAARDRLHARAARIAEPSRRASFLSRVPDHVRLRALAARLEGAPDATRDAAAE